MKVPKLLSKVWASSGLKNDIPIQRTDDLPKESATYQDGFPQITMTPISVGGKAPSGKDMNGILNELSAHTVFQNQGGIYQFDKAFAEEIGGYPKGAILINDELNLTFQSLVDKNKTNFNMQDYAGKWVVVFGGDYFVQKTQKATITKEGIVQLTNNTNSDSETLALTAKAGRKLAERIEQDFIQNNKKSSAVNSNSEDDVATPKAVKAAYDKAVEAKKAADAKQSPATTLSGYGISNFKVENATGDLNNYRTDGIYCFGSVGGTSNLPRLISGNLQVIKGGAGNERWCRQIFHPHYSDEMWMRWQTSGSNDEWSPWKKLNTDGIPVGAIVSFPREVSNPAGFLRANGTTFNAQTFSDLHRTLGSNKLPNLTRSDVGMTAYFAVDNIPDGWIAFDEIATRVTQQSYPELYGYLVGKYGSIANVPKAEDRFIRNAGNGLGVGQVQSDEIKAHNHATNWQVSNESGVADNEIASGSRNRENAWFRLRTENTGGTETRPKSLVLKLCIKAINTFDDVVFWIKSHGEVTNAGVLDAGRLAQGLQDKADRNHTHTTSQIADFNQGVTKIIEQGFTYQKIGGFEIRKYPDGTMIQTCSINQYDIGGASKSFNWAQAFVGVPLIFTKITTEVNSGHDCNVNVLSKSNNATVNYIEYEHGTPNQGHVRVQFLAIGRWK